ncbi:hypothetical protein LN042_07160 [Kitasatospora sp. RB6PN24]|uniref:hypothetical protein n=1 Tax=Kitasatospora humi TaxID=2893891 RepID=UPI001E543C67|nr:hypothetical protein [Kitasatospora humi]MCC9306885.1 hypothetical protein [Kitasatospora humi]
MMVIQCLFHESVLADDPHTTRFGAEWWGVVAFGTLATGEGFRTASFSRTLPFAGPRQRQPEPVRKLLALAVLVYVISGGRPDQQASNSYSST